MEHDRLNSPNTLVITFEMMGHQLQFAQDPNSKHLGTTVWDASMVLVKYLEKNSRRGRFCPSKLKGKHVIELGAGCGVAGFGMALLGCDVIATDQIEVLPLLSRNVERNTARILQMNPDSFGSIRAAELDWGNVDHIRAVDPPFDYIIGTDVVYAEHLLEPLLQTISALSGPKTCILLGYEIRSTSVHEQMLDMWRRNFDVKIVPKAKMHTEYQHPSIQLYIMNMKSVMTSSFEINQKAEEESIQNGSGEDKTNQKVDKQDEVGITKSGPDHNCKGKSCMDMANDIVGGAFKEDFQLMTKHKGSKLSDWEARRYGSMAARFLRDVQIK